MPVCWMLYQLGHNDQNMLLESSNQAIFDLPLLLKLGTILWLSWSDWVHAESFDFIENARPLLNADDVNMFTNHGGVCLSQHTILAVFTDCESATYFYTLNSNNSSALITRRTLAHLSIFLTHVLVQHVICTIYRANHCLDVLITRRELCVRSVVVDLLTSSDHSTIVAQVDLYHKITPQSVVLNVCGISLTYSSVRRKFKAIFSYIRDFN